MTLQDQREAARQFYNNWKGKGEEKQYSQKFWLDLLQNVYGVSDPYRYIDFEKTVHYSDGEKKITDRFADGYIAETKVLIEQKSANIDLGAKQSGHNDKTPYEQAKEYNDNFRADDKVKWIILCNFKEFWIFNLNDEVPTPVKFSLKELPTKLSMLNFLVKKEVKKITDEEEVSKEAGVIISEIYEEFLKQYRDPEDPEILKSLNKLCVRLVFCLYAEDAGLFGKKDLFHDYLERFDAQHARKALINLFVVLNQKIEDRDDYLEDDDEILAMFPYVNGGLFDEVIEIPPLTDELMKLILEKASENFDWSVISPTIFGSIFENTLNPDTRREGGMHYTSIEDIHKVIDPLFMDDLYNEFEGIKSKSNAGGARTRALNSFREKLANLVFLDPACGSGNFLTESFISLRRLENLVLKELSLSNNGQGTFSFLSQDEMANIGRAKVSISQFYGIEINDFAVSVAKTALWIAEAQMMQETISITDISEKFFPLKTNAYIIEDNALRLDWNDVVSSDEVNYIMGNPPFRGYSMQNDSQKEDMIGVVKDENGRTHPKIKKIDYVAGWYFKAVQYIQHTNIRVGFVSTSSIVQGEQVAYVWGVLLDRFNTKIIFAHKPFLWSGEAHVYCVIVAFSCDNPRCDLYIYEGDTKIKANNISPYLIDYDNIYIEAKRQTIQNVPPIMYGSKPTDHGYLFLEEDEYKDVLSREPFLKPYIKRFLGADEFLNDEMRYCFWLVDIPPKIIKQSKILSDRIKGVREFRSASKKRATREAAEYPTLFQEIRQPNSDYILIPGHTGGTRKYIPMGFENKDTICGNANFCVPNAGLYEFGILQSNVHMAWTSVVCGYLGTSYRYSASIVYNNFPWPTPTEAQKKRIEQTAQGILDARAMFPDDTLADMYDIDRMHKTLRKAHQANDVAVMKAYGLDVDSTSEANYVAYLFELHQKITNR